MKVTEATDDRLVLVDNQLDKKVGVGLASAVLLFTAYQFASGGGWGFAGVLVAGVAAMVFYLWWTRMTSVFTFDRPSDSVTLVTQTRKGRQEWDWRLSDIASARVSEVRSAESGDTSSIKRPVFVLKDGTKVPMRPYHSAGGQSWQAIEAIRKFIGDPKRDDFPVGYIFDPD